MGTRIATLRLVGYAGSELDLHVFDDALVALQPGKTATVGLAFGAAGGAFTMMSMNPKTTALRAEAENLGDDARSEDLAAIDGAEVTRLADVAHARVEKGFAKARKVVLRTADGKKRTYRYAENCQPTADVADALSRALGDRFVHSTA